MAALLKHLMKHSLHMWIRAIFRSRLVAGNNFKYTVKIQHVMIWKPETQKLTKRFIIFSQFHQVAAVLHDDLKGEMFSFRLYTVHIMLC